MDAVVLPLVCLLDVLGDGDLGATEDLHLDVLILAYLTSVILLVLAIVAVCLEDVPRSYLK